MASKKDDPPGDDIELSPEEDAALDSVWDKIARGEIDVSDDTPKKLEKKPRKPPKPKDSKQAHKNKK